MKSRVLGSILRVGRCCNAYRKQRLKGLDLCPAQHLYITQACRHPGCTQEQLAAAFCIDKTTVARQLLKLEQDGYIERRVSPEDGRCRCVYPTLKAQALYPQIHGAYESFEEGLLEGLSEQELAELVRLTDILRRNAIRLAQEEK